jgi:hypothetical protein
MGTGSSFPGVKADGAWNWPLTSSWCRSQENVDLYIHSPIRLHGVVLNYLSTGTTLPLPVMTVFSNHDMGTWCHLQMILSFALFTSVYLSLYFSYGLSVSLLAFYKSVLFNLFCLYLTHNYARSVITYWQADTRSVKKSPMFYGTHNFITLFRTSRHWIQFWAR